MAPQSTGESSECSSYVFITYRKEGPNLAIRLTDRPKLEELNFFERWLFKRHCFKAYKYMEAMQSTVFTMSRQHWVITCRATTGNRLFVDVDAQPVAGREAANDSDYAWIGDVHDLCISIRFNDYTKYEGLSDVERRVFAEVIYNAGRNRMPTTAFPRSNNVLWKLKLDWGEKDRVKVRIDENPGARLFGLLKKYGPFAIGVIAAVIKALNDAGFLG
jgi:hypothetical protein